jgi:TolB-like protein/Tfp pilus assembly protein PilF
LRRRKVVQWGLLYAACAWGFLQGLEYVAESFHWPDQVRQVSILALLTGLPIALVIAWYHGDLGARRVSGTELAIVTLLFLLGSGLFWWYDRAIRDDSAPAMAETEVVRAEATSTDPRPSIAVLPFENRSRLPDDVYFVDGIHDDILTQLSKIRALRVISRTSVEQFRDTTLSSREIAAKLGVTRVLEGGVQRAGNRVRINVQLIDARTDAHLWAERYDRELTVANLFEIQSEVAAAISTELQATLTAAERLRMSARPTESLEAWEAYQRGRRELEKRTTSSLVEAERMFQQAIEHDPEFALAYAGQARSVLLQDTWNMEASGRSNEQAAAFASELLERALTLHPDLPEAIAQAAALADQRDEHARSERLYQRAIALDPNSASAHHQYGGLLGELGRIEDAHRQFELALALDPVSSIVRYHLAKTLFDLGRIDEYLAELRKTIAIDPGFAMAYLPVGTLSACVYGRVDMAIPWIEKAATLDPGNPTYSMIASQMHLALDDEAAANRWLQLALQHGTSSGWDQQFAAVWYLYRGDFAAFERQAQKTGELKLLTYADLRRGDPAAARARYAEAYPNLLAANTAKIDELELAVQAKNLAYVLQQTGEGERARLLLDRSEAYFRNTPPKEWANYQIHYIALLAMRGDYAKALATLRDADLGMLCEDFLFGWRYYRDIEPTLASIRNEPEFKAAFARIDAEMAAQRARLAARPRDAPLNFEPIEELVASRARR